MRIIIAVTESRAMPGRFTIKCDAARDKRGVVPSIETRGAESAAAEALQYAIRSGSRGYAIIAPAAMLACIPEDMRERT